jgi:hypothetical protein
MNVKILGGFILAVVLSFFAGFGLSTYNHHVETTLSNKFEGQVTTIIQNSLDTQFGQINKDYKDGIQKSFDQYLADKKAADDASRLLNSGGPDWVWVKPADEQPASPAKAGTSATGSKPASPVRAQLSAESSVPLKREAKRADDCAVDYNKLKSQYDTLWLSVWKYNQSVDNYNSQFKK